MAEQRLLYSLEGDASGLKKALAESEAAHRRLTDALTRKGIEIGALKSAEEGLKKIDAAAAEARRKMEFFRRSAELAPGGIKQFSKDINKASKDLARLTQQAQAQRAQIASLRSAAGGTGAEIVAAEEGLANANAQKRVALLEAERQARVNYGKQVLAGLQAQALETARVAEIERRRAADDAANARAAAANARVRAAAQQSAAQAAQANSRLQAFASGLPRFDLKGNAAAKLAEITAAADKSKQALNDALTAARNFGRDGASQAQGFSGQLKSLALQAVAVTTAIKGIGAVVNTGIQGQRLEAKFQFATGGDNKKAAADLAFVRAEADRLALPLLEAADGFSKLASSTQGTNVEGEKTRQIFTGISSAMRVLGAPTYQVERAFNAVVQSISKGNLQAEEIRGQLAESIPGAFRILAKALDTTEEKLNKDLKAGLVNGAEAMVAFSKELERMSQSGLLAATTSFQAQMVRLSNTLFDFRDIIANAGLLDAFGAEITTLTDKLREMADTGELQAFAKDFAQIIGTIARVLGTATRLAIEHRDTLASLALLFAGFKIAKGVQGIAIAWGAAATAISGAGVAITGVTGAGSILFALLGGPVGITAAILAAAAAWDVFHTSGAEALDNLIKKNGGLKKSMTQAIEQFNAGGLGAKAGYDEATRKVSAYREQVAATGKTLADIRAKRATGLEYENNGLFGKLTVLKDEEKRALSAVVAAKNELARAERFVIASAATIARDDRLAKGDKKPVAKTAAGKIDKSGIAAAKREAEALLRAQQELERNRIEAEALGLADSLDARKQLLDQRRKDELIDEETFIRAKTAIDEEGLRNELTALQAQQAKLRIASTDAGAKGSERVNALADLALVDARIESASQKILNLNQSAVAELAAIGAAKLKAQADFIDGLEQEAFLAALNNDERETALLLLEAEKLGIADVNRLLELQGQIRQANADKDAAKETQRQQDDVYKNVQQGVQKAFADGLNAVASGEGGIRGALLNLVNTIRGALSNAIAGGLTESFLGMLGGKEGVLNIAGSLGFGGKKDGSTAASALFVRDVAGAGALTGGISGAGGEGGGMFAGFFEGIKSFFSNLTSGFSNLFSGLAKSLSGLFSGGSGGGGGSGNVGGWVTAIASLFGYADGGWTGPGSKYQPAGIVHADEFVFDKASTNRIGVGVLENMRRMASGRFASPRPRLSYAEGGLVNLPGSAPPTVNANTKVVNMFDLDSALAEYLNTRGGERAILNVIQRNPGATGF